MDVLPKAALVAAQLSPVRDQQGRMSAQLNDRAVVWLRQFEPSQFIRPHKTWKHLAFLSKLRRLGLILPFTDRVFRCLCSLGHGTALQQRLIWPSLSNLGQDNLQMRQM